jgi:hypothetical protein
MKREFSFYEFVGILVPSTLLLFFTNSILEFAFKASLFDFAKIGDSFIFIIVAYGVGHILHSFGNLLETVLWKILNGIPTNWLTQKPRFFSPLFDEDDTSKIKEKLWQKFGKSENKDYGRLVYSWLFNKNITARIDIFNGNYSLFRGLSVCFILLAILSGVLISWQVALVCSILALLSLARMIRFAQYYAREIYRTFLTYEEK